MENKHVDAKGRMEFGVVSFLLFTERETDNRYAELWREDDTDSYHIRNVGTHNESILRDVAEAYLRGLRDGLGEGAREIQRKIKEALGLE